MTDPGRPLTRRDALAANSVDLSTVSSPEDDAAARRRITLIAVAAGVIFLLLGTGAVYAGIASGKGGVAAIATPAPTSTAVQRTVPPDQVAAADIPTCSITALAGKSALGNLAASVDFVKSGDQAYTSSPSTGFAPAASMKVLTAAAAVAKLGPSYRITTKVVDGVNGTIALVGEGDPTLSAVGTGDSVYAGAPSITTLAQKALAAYTKAHPDGPTISHVVLDSSYWDPNDNWNSNHPRSLQTGGFLSETTALQVDGDRKNPKLQVSPRSTDPIGAAGKAFVKALGIPGVTASTGLEENGAPTLASVKSQPVSVLVQQMLLSNDDTLAEQLARIISVKENLQGTSASVQQAIMQALSGYDIDTSGLTIDDGSGESPKNSVSAGFLASFMSLVEKGQGNMKYVAAGMPLAGRTGSLVGRFTGAATAGVGHVYAKPGSIPSSYTLAGYLKAKDGTNISFAFFAEGNVAASANAALDTLATAVYQCGKNLTTY